MNGRDYLDVLLGVGEKPRTSQVDSGTVNGNSLSSCVVGVTKKGLYEQSVTTTPSDASMKRVRFNGETRGRRSEDEKLYLQLLTAYNLSDIPKGKGNSVCKMENEFGSWGSLIP